MSKHGWFIGSLALSCIPIYADFVSYFLHSYCGLSPRDIMAAAICVVTVSYFEIDRYGNSAEFIMKILFVAIAVFAVSYAAMGQDATKREWLLAISCFLGILTVCCKELFFKSVKVKESKDG